MLAFASRPSSKKKRVYGRNMVPFPGANCAGGPVLFDRLGRRKNRLPVALRRSRGGQIAGVSAETPAIEKGSCQGRQALTEGLWVSYRNGLSVTGRLLLHRACNPSASHPLSTSPYTGEARDGRRWPAPHRFAGLTRGGRRSLAPHRFEGAVGKARSPSFFVSVPRPKEAGLRAEHRGDLLTGG